jgi:hypothetical protein
VPVAGGPVHVCDRELELSELFHSNACGQHEHKLQCEKAMVMVFESYSYEVTK